MRSIKYTRGPQFTIKHRFSLGKNTWFLVCEHLSFPWFGSGPWYTTSYLELTWWIFSWGPPLWNTAVRLPLHRKRPVLGIALRVLGPSLEGVEPSITRVCTRTKPLFCFGCGSLGWRASGTRLGDFDTTPATSNIFHEASAGQSLKDVSTYLAVHTSPLRIPGSFSHRRLASPLGFACGRSLSPPDVSGSESQTRSTRLSGPPRHVRGTDGRNELLFLARPRPSPEDDAGTTSAFEGPSRWDEKPILSFKEQR